MIPSIIFLTEMTLPIIKELATSILCIGTGIGAFTIYMRRYRQQAVASIIDTYKDGAGSNTRANCMRIARIIDPSCDGEPLYIGICNKKGASTSQAIRRGEHGVISRLVLFIREGDTCYYVFEDGVELAVKKSASGDCIEYIYQADNNKITGIMTPPYKAMRANSDELDAIATLMDRPLQ